jgi:hypothetical protein
MLELLGLLARLFEPAAAGRQHILFIVVLLEIDQQKKKHKAPRPLPKAA